MAPPHRLSRQEAGRGRQRAGLSRRTAGGAAALALLLTALLCVPAALGVRPFGAVDRVAATEVPPAVADAGLRPLAVAVTDGGAPLVLVLVGVLLAGLVGVLVRRRRAARADSGPLLAPVLLLLLGPVVAWQVDVVAKLLVAAPRPDLAGPLVEAGGYGMPSGHATTAAAFATALALAVRPLLAPGRARTALDVGAVLLALLVGGSRVLLGVHWVSDVVAGWALGVGVVLLLAAALAPARERRTGASRPPTG